MTTETSEDVMSLVESLENPFAKSDSEYERYGYAIGWDRCKHDLIRALKGEPPLA